MFNPGHHLLASFLGCALLVGCGDAVAQPRGVPEAGGESVPTPAMDVWLRRLVGRYRFDGAALPSMGSTCGAEGPPTCSGIKGTGDCIGIGDGPGVQCIFNATWQEIWGQGSMEPLLSAYLDPAMALFGLDPGRPAISMMLVNDRGLPEGGSGIVRGNTATFRVNCVNTPVFAARSTMAELREPAPPVAQAGGADADAPVQGEPVSPVNAEAPTYGSGDRGSCYHTIRIEAKADSSIVYMWLEPHYIQLTMRRKAVDEAGGGGSPTP